MKNLLNKKKLNPHIDHEWCLCLIKDVILTVKVGPSTLTFGRQFFDLIIFWLLPHTVLLVYEHCNDTPASQCLGTRLKTWSIKRKVLSLLENG